MFTFRLDAMDTHQGAVLEPDSGTVEVISQSIHGSVVWPSHGERMQANF